MSACVSVTWMIVGCNIWIICSELNWFFYGPSQILQLCKFVLMLYSLVCIVFNNFLLIDASDRSKISSNPHRILFDVSLTPHSFFANTPFKMNFNNLLPMIEVHCFSHPVCIHVKCLSMLFKKSKKNVSFACWNNWWDHFTLLFKNSKP